MARTVPRNATPVRIACRLLLATILSSATAPLAAQSPNAPPPPAVSEFPALETVRIEVRKHFTALKGRQSDDLLTQGDVVPLFRRLADGGWTVADEKDILAQVLPDDDPLARQLRTPAGLKFMRKVGAIPEGFDRLDRLHRMPDGQRQVRELIRTPGGEKLIEYLATTSQGANLGRTLSAAPRGRRFNQPTTRLYTETDLLQRLEQSYARETAKRAEKRP